MLSASEVEDEHEGYARYHLNNVVRKRLEQTVAVSYRGPDCDGEPRRRVCAGEIGWNWERAKRATERLVEVPSI